MFVDPHEDAAQDESEEEEEEQVQVTKPPAKKTKLMADAMPNTALAPKPKPARKGKGKGAATTATKRKEATAANQQEEDAPTHLKRLRPFLPAHDDTHLEAEDMKKRKDKGLRKWRVVDPYVARSRKTAVDYKFHTIE